LKPKGTYLAMPTQNWQHGNLGDRMFRRKIDSLMKKRTKARRTYYLLIPLGFVLVTVLLFYETMLMGAGRFLTPEGRGDADVVIVEGVELRKEKAVEMGIEMLSSGRANRLVVVDYGSAVKQASDRLENRALSLARKLEGLGLRADRIQLIEVPVDHPATLGEAQFVVSVLSKSGVRSAVLLAEGFHTRRSYWAYKEVGSSLGIEIVPCPYFVSYGNENWWRKNDGVRAFARELAKFIYYVLRGYIPAKSLVTT
jgi:uncharacterized SAM-binding protein YcdF (DUF218 family)